MRCRPGRPPVPGGAEPAAAPRNGGRDPKAVSWLPGQICKYFLMLFRFSPSLSFFLVVLKVANRQTTITKSCCRCFGAVALWKTTPWVEARAACGSVGVFANQMSLGGRGNLAKLPCERGLQAVQARSPHVSLTKTNGKFARKRRKCMG